MFKCLDSAEPVELSVDLLLVLVRVLLGGGVGVHAFEVMHQWLNLLQSPNFLHRHLAEYALTRAYPCMLQSFCAGFVLLFSTFSNNQCECSALDLGPDRLEDR